MFEEFNEIERPELLNPLVLAYIGDAVYELYVRIYIAKEGTVKTNALHRASISFVSAKAQANILAGIEENLSEDEANIVRRGRNAHSNTIPKNASIADYKKATAFEALIGYLFLKNDIKRLEEIVKLSIKSNKVIKENQNGKEG